MLEIIKFRSQFASKTPAEIRHFYTFNQTIFKSKCSKVDKTYESNVNTYPLTPQFSHRAQCRSSKKIEELTCPSLQDEQIKI